MSFGDAIGECFFNYANFRDRAARSEYWWWALFATVVCLLAWLLDLVVFNGFSVSPFLLVVYLAFLLPGLSVTVRRLHDTGRSGWWLLVPLGSAVLVAVVSVVAAITNPQGQQSTATLLLVGIPTIVSIGTSVLLLIWMALPSIPGNNHYGPNRYAGA
jgi:uncharacterized membrane protein YhaH (DUF805 family)